MGGERENGHGQNARTEFQRVRCCAPLRALSLRRSIFCPPLVSPAVSLVELEINTQKFLIKNPQPTFCGTRLQPYLHKGSLDPFPLSKQRIKQQIRRCLYSRISAFYTAVLGTSIFNFCCGLNTRPNNAKV